MGACLASLEGQSARHALEVIVVDSGRDHTAALVREAFPWVRLLTFSQRLYPGRARNIAVGRARGEIIAFLDADAEAEGGWAEAILAAHQAPQAVVAGAIRNANPESLVSWAAYLAKFSSRLPGNPPGRLKFTPGLNLSLPKTILAQCGPFLEQGYCSDLEYCWRLRQAGYAIRFDPAILVAHRHTDDFRGLCLSQWERGWDFGKARLTSPSFSRLRRWLRIFLAGAVPVKMLGEIFLRARRRPEYLEPFLRVWPLLLVELACWAAGEAAGIFKSGALGRAAGNGGWAGGARL